MEEPKNLLPVAGKERIAALDIARGMALLGILLVNMQFFNSPAQYAVPVQAWWWDNPWDKVAEYLITVFAEGKFYPIFSFLFGLGFCIFMERAEQKERTVTKLYLRRVFLLLLFGILHVTLLWWGDILHFYALMGILLLFFRHKSPGKLLRWSSVLLILPLLIVNVIALITAAAEPAPEHWKGFSPYAYQMIESSLSVYPGDDFQAVYRQRLADFFLSARHMYIVAPHVLAMFLLGMYAARRGLVQNAAEHQQLLHRVWSGSILTGAFFVTLQVAGKYSLLPGSFINNNLMYFTGTIAGGTAISLFYMVTILLLLQKQKWYKKLSPLAPVGRMALTNYLLQSLICTTLFYGYGLGLYGNVRPAAGIILTFVIFAGQIIFSRLWLTRYLSGPLEWLWRTLTYGKVQPFKIKELQR